jgi:hypothetical protein
MGDIGQDQALAGVQRECTADEGAAWQRLFGDGYATGRGDARRGHGNRFPVIDVPAELPGENGARYVARHVGIAWEIGYANAWAWYSSHLPASATATDSRAWTRIPADEI